MNYKWHYDRLIETRRSREHVEGVYYERHHIVPRSMGGNDSSANIVVLTPREHFIAHWLLYKIHKNKEMAFAFYAMCYYKSKDNHRNIEISSRTYAEAKELHSKTLSILQRQKVKDGTFKWMHGKKQTQEHRQKIIETRQRENNYKGHTWKLSDEVKKKIGDRQRGKKLSDETKHQISTKLKGRIITEDVRKNMSAAKKGVKFSEKAKQNMSIARKGTKMPDETRKKMIATLTGKICVHNPIDRINKMIKLEQLDYYLQNGWIKGKKVSEEQKKKISEAHKNKKLSAETRKKISEARKKHEKENYRFSFSYFYRDWETLRGWDTS